MRADRLGEAPLYGRERALLHAVADAVARLRLEGGEACEVKVCRLLRVLEVGRGDGHISIRQVLHEVDDALIL